MKRVEDEVVKSHRWGLGFLKGLRKDQGYGSVRLDDGREKTIGIERQKNKERDVPAPLS
jgi:hypothetical protein